VFFLLREQYYFTKILFKEKVEVVW